MSWSGINIEALNRATQKEQKQQATSAGLPYAAYEVYAQPGSWDTGGNQQMKQANTAAILGLQGQQQTPRAQYAGMSGGGGSSGRGRGGGGGRSGPNPAQVRKWAEELFTYNPSILGGIRDQANAYNPDIAGMGAQAQNAMRGFDTERQQRLNTIMQNMSGMAGGVVAANSGAMQGALRDLTAQGVDVNPYIQSATQGQNLATQGLANQAGYVGQLNMLGSQGLADQLGASALTTQGAQGNLAANRQVLLNQIAQQEAQQKQQLEQAKREFLLKYGVS